jgi:hypothetical protein
VASQTATVPAASPLEPGAAEVATGEIAAEERIGDEERIERR